MLIGTFALLLLGGCAKEVNFNCEASGKTVTETWSLEQFTELEVRSGMDIVLRQSPEFSCTVTGDEAMMKQFSPEVLADRLILNYDGCVAPATPLQITLNLPDLHHIILHDVANLQTEGDFTFDELRLEHFGSGTLQLQGKTNHGTQIVHVGSGLMDLELETPTLEVKQSGSGDLLLKGSTLFQRLSLTGSGSFHGFDFFSEGCMILLASTGNAEVWVERILEVTSLQAGSVYYRGNPTVTKQTRGDGTVYKVG